MEKESGIVRIAPTGNGPGPPAPDGPGPPPNGSLSDDGEERHRRRGARRRLELLRDASGWSSRVAPAFASSSLGRGRVVPLPEEEAVLDGEGSGLEEDVVLDEGLVEEDVALDEEGRFNDSDDDDLDYDWRGRGSSHFDLLCFGNGGSFSHDGVVLLEGDHDAGEEFDDDDGALFANPTLRAAAPGGAFGPPSAKVQAGQSSSTMSLTYHVQKEQNEREKAASSRPPAAKVQAAQSSSSMSLTYNIQKEQSERDKAAASTDWGMPGSTKAASATSTSDWGMPGSKNPRSTVDPVTALSGVYGGPGVLRWTATDARRRPPLPPPGALTALPPPVGGGPVLSPGSKNSASAALSPPMPPRRLGGVVQQKPSGSRVPQSYDHGGQRGERGPGRAGPGPGRIVTPNAFIQAQRALRVKAKMAEKTRRSPMEQKRDAECRERKVRILSTTSAGRGGHHHAQYTVSLISIPHPSSTPLSN